MHNYTVTPLNTFEQMFLQMRSDLVEQPAVNVGEWQSQHKDEILMRELLHVTFDMPIPDTADAAAQATGARMPWAEDHFLERVGGEPLNPSPSEQWWPFRDKTGDTTNATHKSEGGAFSHTYPERMWPKHAGDVHSSTAGGPNRGIRFFYGDLQDVVSQLVKHPMTRQAYLPIWFPEDTGAVHGKRVPCTLGYHFIIRDGKLDISYFMRSTDLLRHFQDDVYLALRLAQWVAEKVDEGMENRLGWKLELDEKLQMGQLIFHTANLHIFDQDEGMIKWWEREGRTWF